MKTAKQNKMSYEEELMLFYDKYLNLDFDGNILLGIMKDMLNYAEEKEEQVEPAYISSLQKYVIDENDYPYLTPTTREYIQFFKESYLSINEDYGVYINSLGEITQFVFNNELSIPEQQELSKFTNQSIFIYLNYLEDDLTKEQARINAQNIILQNILTSKIYKAVYEKIEEKSILKALLFATANRPIFSYEESLNAKLDYAHEFKNNLAISRSLR